jgi:hypothetical protein
LKSSFVIQQQILNLTNQCSLSMTVRHIFEISEDDHPLTIVGEWVVYTFSIKKFLKITSIIIQICD